VEIPRAAVCNFAFVNHWIIKSEPFKYSWEQFEKDGSTFWDGVRNFQARNNLREMKVGDLCLYYHSNEGKEMVGIARVTKEHYPDPTTDDHNWVVVDVQPFQKLKKPVSLAQMKADSRLSNLGLIRQSQLSVIKISKDEFDIILSLSEN
jgi:predicted RNA-binding protein with PUA-like domain